MRELLKRIYRRVCERREGWSVPLVMLILVLLSLVGLVWLPPDQFIGGSPDGSEFTYAMFPWWQFALDSLRQGELPLWNPYISSGMPFVANPQPALFYPPVWLVSLLPMTRVVSVLFVLHLWLTGWGMYAWLRGEGASRRGAWVGAAIFAFNGYFFVRMGAGQSDVVMTQVWLPWMLWACRRAMARRRWMYAVLGGIPVGLSLLAGHTATFLYAGIVLGTYALYAAWVECREPDVSAKARSLSLFKALLPVLGMGVVGLALAAVQLVPTLQFLSLSTREEAGYAFAASFSWPPGHLLTLLVPNFFGDLFNTGYWGDGIYVEFIFYVGVLPLILALVSGARLPHRLKPWLLALAGAGLLLAFGRFGALHRLAYALIPLFGAGRVPARAGFLFVFAAAALGGLIVSWVEERPAEALRGRPWGVVWGVVGALAALVVLAGFLLFALQRDSNPDVGRLWHVANFTALFLLFFSLAVALLAGWRRGWLTGAQGAALAIGLVLLDLWSFGRPLLEPMSAPENSFWDKAAHFVSIAEQEAEGAAVTDSTWRVLPWGLNIFEQNLGMPLGLENVYSYDPMWIGRYTRFINYVADPRARAFDLLRARYLVVQQRMKYPQDDPTSPKLVKRGGGVWVYERPGVFPAAWLVHRVEVEGDEEALLGRLNDPAFDPWQAALVEQPLPCSLGLAAESEEEVVRVTRRSNNIIALEVEAAADGLLVLSEVAYPGWRVSVDGVRVPIVRANYTLRAVCVPAGMHRVTFSFQPGSLTAGALISALAWLLAGWAGLRSWVVERRERGR